jgi:hypothetical protein
MMRAILGQTIENLLRAQVQQTEQVDQIDTPVDFQSVPVQLHAT